MRNWLEKKLRHKIYDIAVSDYEKIKVEPKQGMFNYQCYDNAVEYSRLHPEFEVVEVIYSDDYWPILHFINYDPAENKYYETTLGYMCENLEYFKIKKIHSDDFKSIRNYFFTSLAVWNDRYLKWYHKLFFIKRVL